MIARRFIDASIAVGAFLAVFWLAVAAAVLAAISSLVFPI